MKTLTVTLTAQELRLLAGLASDQLFRKEFIDPRMPGHRDNRDEIALGKLLVARIQLVLTEAEPADPLRPPRHRHVTRIAGSALTKTGPDATKTGRDAL